jgi:hypothetical protein
MLSSETFDTLPSFAESLPIAQSDPYRWEMACDEVKSKARLDEDCPVNLEVLDRGT